MKAARPEDKKGKGKRKEGRASGDPGPSYGGATMMVASRVDRLPVGCGKRSAVKGTRKKKEAGQ